MAWGGVATREDRVGGQQYVHCARAREDELRRASSAASTSNHPQARKGSSWANLPLLVQ